MPPAVVMSPVTPPRSHGEPRPVSEPSSESPSENAMEIPAPIEAASPTRNASELCRVANAAANSGASVETEPSISPAKPGCTTCSKNSLRCDSSSCAFAVAVRCFSSNSPAVRACLRTSSASSFRDSGVECARVRALFIGDLVQQFARRDVAGPAGRLVIEALRLQLHQLGLLPRDFHAERTHQPHRPPLEEPFHILAANQRNVFAEALPKHGNQPVAVHRFFLAHVLEHQ